MCGTPRLLLGVCVERRPLHLASGVEDAREREKERKIERDTDIETESARARERERLNAARLDKGVIGEGLGCGVSGSKSRHLEERENVALEFRGEGGGGWSVGVCFRIQRLGCGVETLKEQAIAHMPRFLSRLGVCTLNQGAGKSTPLNFASACSLEGEIE